MNYFNIFQKLDDAETPEEMRKAIFKQSRDCPLIQRAIDHATYNGLSGEDKYTIMAYLALQERAVYGQKCMDIVSLETAQKIYVTDKVSIPKE